MLNIGVFDSGLGGLTVVSELMKHLNGVSLYYVADTKNAPYGEKSPKEILAYSLKITQYLLEKYEIKALVLACNTATAYAIEHLRTLYPNLIIIGTEPALKPAIAQSKSGEIGILATPATLEGKKYQTLAKALCQENDVHIYEQACVGLVEQIEKGEIHTEKTKKLLEVWLKPFREKNVDTIVLGCTHYPLIAPLIYELMSKELTLLHTAKAISNHLLSCLNAKGYERRGTFHLTIEATGEIKSTLVEKILSQEVTILSIDI